MLQVCCAVVEAMLGDEAQAIPPSYPAIPVLATQQLAHLLMVCIVSFDSMFLFWLSLWVTSMDVSLCG